MYHLSADYYDPLYLSFKDYAREAWHLKQVIKNYLRSGGNHLLDVACGTGLHLSYLKNDYEVQGLDFSQDMLDVAHQRLPEIPLHQGDMVDFSLPDSFDVITCMFGSIAYTGSIDRLSKALSCMSKHLKSGGVMIIEPWSTPETYKPQTAQMQIVDQPNLKIARVSTSLQKGRLAVIDMHHLVGTPKETVHFVEHHELGLFDTQEMLAAFKSTSLEVTFESEGVNSRGLCIAQKPLEVL